jgi:ribosomal protein L6P/L9E
MKTKSVQINSSNISVRIQQPEGQLQREHKYQEMTTKRQNNRKKQDKNKGRKQRIALN